MSSGLHICCERIIPDTLDTQRLARHSIASEILTRSNKPLDPAEVTGALRMAVPLAKRWTNGAELKCRFLDGSKKMRTKVEAVAHEWETHANIKFKFVKTGTAEIRISFFADAGSWSAVGTDALHKEYFPLHQPTMNYGWLRDDTKDSEYSRVVLHEFGHALGVIHEHQAPKFDRVWNRAKVLEAFSGPPNFWDTRDIEHNILQKYSPQGMAFSKFDPDSIMLYFFPAELFSDGKGPTKENHSLSDTDKAMMRKLYPKP